MNEELIEPSDDDIAITLDEDFAFDDELSAVAAVGEILDIDVAVAKSKSINDFDATRVYLNELGRSKLLTADQEKVYGIRAQQGDRMPARS